MEFSLLISTNAIIGSLTGANHVYGLTEKYHTLYISKLEDGGIDETDYTQKIIPFVKNGTRIHIDGKYRGMWIHTTAPNYKSIQIK